MKRPTYLACVAYHSTNKMSTVSLCFYNVKYKGGANSHAPPSTVLQVVLYKPSVFFAEFQRIGHLIKTHAARHEFFDILK